MSRATRVRHLTDFELERLVGQEHQDAIVEALLGDERGLSKAQRRLRRLMRELARRDWLNRPHGRRCTCAECMHLLETWRELQRRSVHPDGSEAS